MSDVSNVSGDITQTQPNYNKIPVAQEEEDGNPQVMEIGNSSESDSEIENQTEDDSTEEETEAKITEGRLMWMQQVETIEKNLHNEKVYAKIFDTEAEEDISLLKLIHPVERKENLRI